MAFVGRADTRRGTVLLFLATALAGLAARQLLGSYAVIEALFGPENYATVDTVLRFVSLPTMVVAAVAGYLWPRRFWLWAIAAASLVPLENALLIYQATRAGVIDSSDYFGLAVLDATNLLVLGVLCAVCSGAGAGLRLLVGRISRRPARREGERVDAEGNGRRVRRGFDASRPGESFVEVVRGVLIEPTRFFAGLRESREEERSAWGPLIFAGVCLAVGTLLSFLAEPLDPLAMQDAPNRLYSSFSQASGELWLVALAVVYALAAVPIVLVLGLYLLAGVQHLFVLVFVRERRGFWPTFLVVAYGTGAASLLAWVPVLGHLAGLYRVYVVASGLKELHGTTTTRALLAALVPYLLPLAWSVYNLF